MRKTILGYAVASSLIAAGAIGPAGAQTVGYSEAVGAVGAACSGDIAKFCKTASLGGGRIGQCLAQNGSKVSAGCKTAMVAMTELVKKRGVARAAVMKVCDADIRRLCAGIAPGDGNLLQCFMEARKSVSARCRQTVGDAGYDVQIVPDQATSQIALNPKDVVTGLQGIDANASTLSAASLRQMVVKGMGDPARTSRVNRPPLTDQLNNLAQLTIAIQFDFNSARIRPHSFKAVGLMADAMNHPYLQGYRFLVIGHTDGKGSREANLKLSQARADAIREALINPFAITPARIEAVGLGEEQLLNAADPAAAENRRVQLVNIGK